MELIITLLIIYALWQVCRILKGKADLSIKRGKIYGKKRKDHKKN